MYEAYHIGLLITSIMRTIYVFVQVVNGFDKLSPARSNSISCSARCSPECAVVFNNLSKRRIRGPNYANFWIANVLKLGPRSNYLSPKCPDSL